MSVPSDLRSRKRVAMREAISDAATRLFKERGFDHVTMDDIATAADVGRKTVFNHFPRKEDLFFDRDQEIRDTLRAVLVHCPADISPIEAYRRLAHRLIAEQSPYIEFSPSSQSFIETIEDSETLKARARAIRDELTQVLAETLSECAGRGLIDPDACLTAHLLLATWTAARIQAHQTFMRSRDAEEAKATFVALIEKGTIGIKAALVGTRYA